MSSICFYFQVHQPYRLKKYRIFDIGNDHNYFENHPESRTDNELILKKVIKNCYLPANSLLLKLLNQYPQFKICFSLSGVFLEQLEQYSPEVIESFYNLIKTGQCEILAETYYHSLSSIYSRDEFESQIKKHRQIIKRLFQVTPKVFRNTELIYSNDIAKIVEDLGYNGIITEGVDRILQGRSPNQLYKPFGTTKIVALLKNYKLSDDIAFRFSDKNWTHHPLTTDKFTNWIQDLESHSKDNDIIEPIINLFMDYETFGEHQWEDSGIFDFLEHLPKEFLKNPNNSFVTPSEAINKLSYNKPVDIIKIPDPEAPIDPVTFSQINLHHYPSARSANILPYLDSPEHISWADTERDLSAWRSNEMQHEALDKIYSLEQKVKSTKDKSIISDWQKLTTSDHFYYMCTKYWSDGNVHKYFSPYESPYEAFIYFMNVIKDLEIRLLKFAV
jgi:alpha-amylase